MTWKYYTPKFECDAYNKYMLKYSPWSGHRFFGYDLIANMKPDIVVELGSFYGCSTFAFAQAVKDLQLRTRLYAVDLWEIFDKFTESDYKEDVYGAFLQVKEKCYEEQMIVMMKMSFDQAVENFEDRSIDILHIDGSHFYEDVKHDFETWKSKLKPNAIVLFHDIGDEIINGGIMGSHVYWNEIQQQYPYTTQFSFSCGLGILFMSKDVYEQYTTMIDLEHYQKQNNSFDVQLKDELRKLSFKVKDADFYIADLKKQLAIKDDHLEKYKNERKQLQNDYEETIQKKDNYIEKLETERKEWDKIWKSEKEKIKSAYEKTILGKDAYIKSFEMEKEKINSAWKHDRQQMQEDYEKTIEGKDQYIKELEKKIEEQ